MTSGNHGKQGAVDEARSVETALHADSRQP